MRVIRVIIHSLIILSFIDDVDAVMRLIESEQDDIPDLDDDNDDDDQSKKLDDQNKDPVEGKESDGWLQSGLSPGAGPAHRRTPREGH